MFLTELLIIVPQMKLYKPSEMGDKLNRIQRERQAATENLP